MDERIDKKWMDKWAERLMDERMNWIDDMLDWWMDGETDSGEN